MFVSYVPVYFQYLALLLQSAVCTSMVDCYSRFLYTETIETENALHLMNSQRCFQSLVSKQLVLKLFAVRKEDKGHP